MATLENRLILLGSTNIPLIGTINYFHRYTIQTRDNGEQWVLRSGPENNYDPTISGASGEIIGLTSSDPGNIKFTYEKYRNVDGSPAYSVVLGDIIPAPDLDLKKDGYDYRLHLRSTEVISGTDAEIDALVAEEVARGQELNSREIPYSFPHQNSNTGDAYVTNGIFDYDNLNYKPVEGTGHLLQMPNGEIFGQNSVNLKNQIQSSGGTISGDDIFAPATNEDFESTINTATVAWDLVESSVKWAYEHTGKPLFQIIEEAGSNALEWTINLAQTLGQDVVEMFNSASDFFTNLFLPNQNGDMQLKINQEEAKYIESIKLALSGAGFVNDNVLAQLADQK